MRPLLPALMVFNLVLSAPAQAEEKGPPAGAGSAAGTTASTNASGGADPAAALPAGDSLNTPASEQVTEFGGLEIKDTDDWQSIPETRHSAGGLTIEQIVEPPAEYQYSAFGRIDPFTEPTFAMVVAANKPGGDGLGGQGEGVPGGAEIPVVSPLQKYSINTLKVKGIWLLDGGVKKALIMTPKSEGVIVKIGDPISAGKVIDVYRDYVVVRQYRIRRDGAREYEDHELYLGTRPNESQSFISLKPGEEPKFSSENKQALDEAKPEEEAKNAETGQKADDAQKDKKVGGAPIPAEQAPPAPIKEAIPAEGATPAPVPVK